MEWDAASPWRAARGIDDSRPRRALPAQEAEFRAKPADFRSGLIGGFLHGGARGLFLRQRQPSARQFRLNELFGGRRNTRSDRLRFALPVPLRHRSAGREAGRAHDRPRPYPGGDGSNGPQRIGSRGEAARSAKKARISHWNLQRTVSGSWPDRWARRSPAPRNAGAVRSSGRSNRRRRCAVAASPDRPRARPGAMRARNG